MIRNVVLAKLVNGYDADEVTAIQDGLRNLQTPGTVRYTIGTDAGLRDGNWDFVIVADFEDVAAYRAYDDDAAHNALRARLAPFVDQIARAQFEIADS
ncbi:Stress responsive A/B Barrel Domain-containing protein [Mycolicibacterium aurum]|uniref:Stress responsive A/B Barrel Domain-containing protein n=1 Tax=Mycolicibacterium aurum TaxID=1791 RepID=A0A448IRI9_MYCAU|nr:Dabb family protein [Mycolicibacterium aurum]VEG55162.1 Stress responsive A/B Barrel Domain-containing protein [Mycolicibacterium aurum]